MFHNTDWHTHSAFTIAAQDTTSVTLSWLFYELARHPDYQEKMRAEIKQFRTDLGDKAPSATDYESLPLTAAAIKCVKLPERFLK